MRSRKGKRARKARWTRAKVITELRRLHEDGVRITTHDLKAAGHAEVLWAMYRHLGNVAQARRAAGIRKPKRRKPERKRAYPTPEAALAAFKKLARGSKEPLPAADLPRDLRSALKEHFGSVAEARETARLPPLHPRWSKQTIVRELRRLRRHGVRITVDGLHEAGRDDVINAIYRHIGSLVKTRELAGIPTPAAKKQTKRRTRKSSGRARSRSRSRA